MAKNLRTLVINMGGWGWEAVLRSLGQEGAIICQNEKEGQRR